MSNTINESTNYQRKINCNQRGQNIVPDVPMQANILDDIIANDILGGLA